MNSPLFPALTFCACACLAACAGQTPPPDYASPAPPASAPIAQQASPVRCSPELRKEKFDDVLKGAVAVEHRHCPYVVEGKLSGKTCEVFAHIVRPTQDEMLFEVCDPTKGTGDASCALVLIQKSAGQPVLEMKQGDKLLVTATTMDVKGIWVLDATKVQKAD